MIKNSMQLKAYVRSIAKSDNSKSLIIIRSYMMERFLERVSLSKYRDNIILKGGSLIASMIGNDKRSTMDVDATLANIHLDEETVMKMVSEIIEVKVDDNVIFKVERITTIMEELDYPGIRVFINTTIDKMRTPLKLDFSTGDIITPRPIDYGFKLMFEDRKISVLAYNVETILAEKFETIISRGILNTRMRDFYDIHTLLIWVYDIDKELFISALSNTTKNRGSSKIMENWKEVLQEIQADNNLIKLWAAYQKKFDYAKDIEWDLIIHSIFKLRTINKVEKI